MTFFRIHAVKAADDVAINHVDHRLGHVTFPALDRRYAFLNQDVLYFQTFFDDRHFVALFAVERANIIGTAHGHDAHAVGAGVGFDDDERVVLDAVFLVFFGDFFQCGFDGARQLIFTHALVEIHAFEAGVVGVDQPWINAEEFAEFFRHFIVGGEVRGFATHGPACV